MAKREGQTTQWPKEKDRQHNDQKRRTDNTMAKREGQTTQWPKEKDIQHNGQQRRTDNTMAKREGQTIQWPTEREQNDKHLSTKHYTEKLMMEQHEPH